MNFIDWGRTRYLDALERQKVLVEDRIRERIDDTVIFTEHEPVITIGVSRGAEQHLVVDRKKLESLGIEVCKTNRGGDITYHGPGQVVCYPILLLEKKDLHTYLRWLEDIAIRTIGHFGLKGERVEGKTGIWIQNRKIAAIGIAVRRWVTYHGFALNVNTNLDHFQNIIPCGIPLSEGTVTSMKQELNKSFDLKNVIDRIQSEFKR